MARSHLWRIANALMAAAFLAAAAVQTNDPDPLRWIAIYGAAAAVCAMCVWGRRPMLAGGAALAVLVLAIGWALWIASDLEHMAKLREMFRSMERGGGPIEQTRELGGLALVGGWMIAIMTRRANWPVARVLRARHRQPMDD